MVESPHTLASTEDPFWFIMQPPPDESPEQKEKRLELEAEAKRVSDQIDAALNAERALLKRQKTVRLLLLGQCESGKSTILKQFQLWHSPDAFANERSSWRVVIQLNLVKATLRILDTVLPSIPSVSSIASPIDADGQWDTSASGVTRSRMSAGSFTSTSSVGSAHHSHGLDHLRPKLLPLLRAEEILLDKLASSDMPDFQGEALGGLKDLTQASWAERQANNAEMFARNRSTLKDKATPYTNIPEDKATDIICCCRAEMMALWKNSHVQEVLSHKRLNLSQSSGFFMNDIERITIRDYVPTDDDILAARLKTVGVREHKFVINTATEKGVDWRIYDVGGARSQRAAWAPFFDNVQAIIFLAPISAFDQVLLEDPSVNRLEDSLILWKELCKNTVLSKVPLVLFLNKCDLLKQKLQSGVKLNMFIPSYGDRPNDYESISRFFKSKFDAIRRQYSTQSDREFYVYFTSVNDTCWTTSIITSVRDMIKRSNLRTSNLI